jgi:hypothetical protein
VHAQSLQRRVDGREDVLRDSPPPFGPGVICPWTFVAMTTSLRLSILPSNRPVATSLAPRE